jgi:DUF1365 family protein
VSAVPAPAPAPASSGVPAADTVGADRELRSAVYSGRVVHHRHTPVEHRFTYTIAMVYLELSEVAEVCALHPLWSEEGHNAISFRRADYLGDTAVPLDIAVRDLVEDRTGVRPCGPIGVLTQLRTWGWLFNPITVYYCWDPAHREVETVVVEVTNTPWHERTAYVLPGTGVHRAAKGMHVSPFLPMDLTHRFTIGEPGRRIALAVDDYDGGELVFAASMALTREPAGRRTQGRLLWRFPLMTLRVSLGIYRQALALRRKGVPFHPHPDRSNIAVVAPIDGQER